MIRSENAGLSSERLARIQPVVEKHLGPDKIAGAVTLVARHGKVVHLESAGLMERERHTPMRPDTICRLYSMTKPLICAALLTLYEQGRFQLLDPVAKFIPACNALKVYTDAPGTGATLVAPQRPITIRDLLTHTSGMTYPFFEYGRVEGMYREAGVWSEKPLAEYIHDVLQLPLAFQPGTAWRYSIAHDVVAHLIEVISGQRLDDYLHERLFTPLGMVDTGFFVPPNKLNRFASLYGAVDVERNDTTFTAWYQAAATGVAHRLAGPKNSRQSAPHNVLRGGTGLVSTAQDYWQFCQMLLNNGTFNGVRILGRKTVELLTTNHLHPDLMPFEIAGNAFTGYGFGLGMRVLLDVGQSAISGSVGEYGWAGAASTYFWIDPAEALIGIVLAQQQPAGYFPIANDFRGCSLSGDRRLRGTQPNQAYTSLAPGSG